jgi:ABC-type Fe3+/spermidine/putrescine transport system ATPase subunit
MTEVTLSGLGKTYPGAARPALDGLTLAIASGELTALLGPSGCGKTTAMKMIAGLLEPSAGDIAFDGRSILTDSPDKRGAVMVFQNALLFPYMSVADNVGFGLKMRKLPKAQIDARVAAMLEQVQLPGLGDRSSA